MVWFGKDAPVKAESPKKKICCACPDTKAPRDECIATHGPDDPRCVALIEAHKACLRSEGFKRRAVSAAELDALASGLPGGSRWWGPHRTLWLGNYGVSVLELAFAKLGKELRWNDRRNGDLSFVTGGRCWAIVVNVRSAGWLAALTGGRHWFGLRRFGDTWYNLDSRLAAPEPLQDAGSALQGNNLLPDHRQEAQGLDSSVERLGTSAAVSEQLPRTQLPVAAGTTDCGNEAVSQQSIAALIQFLRPIVEREDALLFEIRHNIA